MAGRRILDEVEARRCLEAARASGLQRAEWARQNGVDARSLNAWRLNLDRARRTPRAERLQELRLVELVPTAPKSSTGCRIRRGDFVVEVDLHFDDEVLARVLAVVARC
ncbi:MAG TPA: hypothetical protein ENK57_18270 [Polyangiaceae bacterium]|nr:hypothetical protein [Polyangiaceae bacterium]